MNECIICLDEIQENHLFDLSCCSVKIHKICMYNWINSNLCKNKELNKDINKCIFCKQESQQLNNIIEIIKQNNDYIIIDTQETNIITSTNSSNIENQIVTIFNNRKKIIGICLINVIFFVVASSIILLVFLI